MSEESRGFSEAARRLASAGQTEAAKAIDAAFAAGRPVHEAGTGADADSTYRVWPDGRRERIESSAGQAQRPRAARTA
jgi:hypothetical protein